MFMKNDTKRNINKKEAVFLCAVLIKMFVQSITMSVIPVMIGENICEYIFKILTYSSYLLVVVSFALDPSFRPKELLVIGIIILISVLGSYFSGNGIMLTLIYLYGAKNINIERIVNKAGCFFILVFFFIIAFSQLNIIEDWDFFRNTNRPRWGVGYTYPTHASSAFFMAVLIFCYLKKHRINCLHIILIELLNCWIYKKTDSRAGFVLSAVVPMLFYILKYSRKPTYRSKIAWLLQWVFPICAISIIIMTSQYNDKGILKVANSLLSNRLYYSQYSMNQYGIHLLGQKIEWVGWGGYGHTFMTMSDTYNYVDTSYIKLLLENGVLVWGMIMIGWTLTSRIAYKMNNKYLLWSMGILAVYCMAEQWLMNLGANPFVLMLVYSVYSISNKKSSTMIIHQCLT